MLQGEGNLQIIRSLLASPELAATGLAALLMALPFCATAQPRSIDLNDLVARQCGAPGYRADSGCKLELGHGTFSVSETVRLGGCTTSTVRNSVTFEGRSAGLMATMPTAYPTGGTTLKWTGPPGAAMFDACGASFLSLRDLTLDAAKAGVAIRVSADNLASATSHFVELRNLVIYGARTGVHITGRNYSDQVDFVTLERVSISNVDVGYLQDSQQSVGGRAQTVEVVARKRGFEIRNGSLNCDNCYVGTAPDAGDDFIAFHLTRSSEVAKPWEGHHQVSIEHSHMELQRGRFIVEDFGAHFPITLIGNSYSLQCAAPGCEMKVVDSSSMASLVMIGEVIQASSNPPANPKALICHRGPELVRLGVYKKPEVGALEVACWP